MNNEISTEQRLQIWNEVLNIYKFHQVELENGIGGICINLMDMMKKFNIYIYSSNAALDTFPELLKYKPLGILPHELWWKHNDFETRINVIKEIINQLEEEQLLYPTKTE